MKPWMIFLALPLGCLYGFLAKRGTCNSNLPFYAPALAVVFAFNICYIYPAAFYGNGLGDIMDAIEQWFNVNFLKLPTPNTFGEFLDTFALGLVGLPLSMVVYISTILYYPVALVCLLLIPPTFLIMLPSAVRGLFVRHSPDPEPPPFQSAPPPRRQPEPPPLAAHWRVLGLKPGATVQDIKDTFRHLAKHRHPDFGGTNAAMREAIEAYEAAIAEVTREH